MNFIPNLIEHGSIFITNAIKGATTTTNPTPETETHNNLKATHKEEKSASALDIERLSVH